MCERTGREATSESNINAIKNQNGSRMSEAGGGGTAFDLAIIGGGINGCGIARDAAGRGLKVVLVEQGDLAGATSSASTKLIHGGLRYPRTL